MSSPIVEKVEDALTGNDEPVGKAHPEATWSFIWLIYPVALIAMAIAILVFTELGK